MDEIIQTVVDEYFIAHPTIDPKGVLRLWIPVKVLRLLAERKNIISTPDTDIPLTCPAGS